MSNKTTIVVPSKYADVFAPFLASAEVYAKETRKIVVLDGNADKQSWYKARDYMYGNKQWNMITAPAGPFCFARNVNLAIRHSGAQNIMICNDDVRFTQPETVEALEYALAKRPDIGIISPRIDGVVGNPIQRMVKPKTVEYSEMRLAFVCVLIRAEVFQEIGLLDEQFGDGDYGFDDTDFCLRAKQGGWKLAVNGEVSVKHGSTPWEFSSSYRRTKDEYEDSKSKALFFKKWGHTNLW